MDPGLVGTFFNRFVKRRYTGWWLLKQSRFNLLILAPERYSGPGIFIETFLEGKVTSTSYFRD
jgi:hypothetical protein